MHNLTTLGTGFIHLFFSRHFRLHRVVGLTYLLIYTFLWFWFINDTAGYLQSYLTVILPILGVTQTIVAMSTFTFLPKNKENSGKQGYFSDKNVMSYDFLCENIFFSGILLFQWVYYLDVNIDSYLAMYKANTQLILKLLLLIIENILVFLPYTLLRPFTPKTSFRDSIYNTYQITDYNKQFMFIAANMTRVFYVVAKHHLGFYLNYLRFLNWAGPTERYYVYLMLLYAAFATTIAMFLHTLKFKKYISARTAMITYIISYLLTLYSLARIMLVTSPLLEIVILGGVIINFWPKRYQDVYQICVLLVFNYIRLSLHTDYWIFDKSTLNQYILL